MLAKNVSKNAITVLISAKRAKRTVEIIKKMDRNEASVPTGRNNASRRAKNVLKNAQNISKNARIPIALLPAKNASKNVMNVSRRAKNVPKIAPWVGSCAAMHVRTASRHANNALMRATGALKILAVSAFSQCIIGIKDCMAS